MSIVGYTKDHATKLYFRTTLPILLGSKASLNLVLQKNAYTLLTMRLLILPLQNARMSIWTTSHAEALNGPGAECTLLPLHQHVHVLPFNLCCRVIYIEVPPCMCTHTYTHIHTHTHTHTHTHRLLMALEQNARYCHFISMDPTRAVHW
jgi:hypothetical protein